MPNIRHLKKSFELLSEAEAIEVVRQTRRDRVAYVPPKAKKKVSSVLDGPPKRSRKAADPNAPKTPRKPRVAKPKVDTKAGLQAMLSNMTPEQKANLLAKLGAL